MIFLKGTYFHYFMPYGLIINQLFNIKIACAAKRANEFMLSIQKFCTITCNAGLMFLEIPNKNDPWMISYTKQ